MPSRRDETHDSAARSGDSPTATWPTPASRQEKFVDVPANGLPRVNDDRVLFHSDDRNGRRGSSRLIGDPGKVEVFAVDFAWYVGGQIESLADPREEVAIDRHRVAV